MSPLSLPGRESEAQAGNGTCLMLRASWWQTREQSGASLSHDPELELDPGGKGSNVRKMRSGEGGQGSGGKDVRTEASVESPLKAGGCGRRVEEEQVSWPRQPSSQPFWRAQGETGGCLLQNLTVGPEGCCLQSGERKQLNSCLVPGLGAGGYHARKQVTEAPLQTTGQGSDCLLECSIQSSDGPVNTTCLQMPLVRMGLSC